MRRILVVSNGIGEDSMAAEIVRRLPADLVADAYPTLGDGAAYRGICDIVGPRAELPSQGNRAARGSLWRDVRGGVLGTIGPSLSFLRAAGSRYERILIVGDQLMVVAAWLVGLRQVVYVDVYRTGFERPYWAAEKALMRRVAEKVFCRTDVLATSLRAAGIDAVNAGNVMMDTIPYGAYDAAARRSRARAVLLLPGSRETTLDNFRIQSATLAQLPRDIAPDVFVALAPGVDAAALASAAGLEFTPPSSGEAGDAGSLSGADTNFHLSRGVLGNLLAVSDIVMAQAGTATMQAIGSGVPAMTFAARITRSARVRALNALYGDARILIDRVPQAAARTLAALLADDADRRRRAALGRSRIGRPGAIKEIVAELLAGKSSASRSADRAMETSDSRFHAPVDDNDTSM